MEYTEADHAEKLLMMLERERGNVCTECPASHILMSISCPVCLAFVGMGEYEYCPCLEIGHEAIKRTWIALEEKGYI